MNDIIDYISDLFTSTDQGPLAMAIIGVVILVLGLAIVKLLVGILRSVLKKIPALSRRDDNGKVIDLVSPIVSLTKAILTIFVLMAVLQHFGLTDVLAPLKELVNKITSAIPNVLGAAIIAYAGWFIARTASQLVAMALHKVDQKIAEKTDHSEVQISAFGSAFVFASVLLPILVAALGVLDIRAISVPASRMIEELMAAVPNIVGAAIILIVAYYAARFVVFMLDKLLDSMQADALPAKIGAGSLFSERYTLTDLVGSAIMFFSMLAATTAAVDVLGIEIISLIVAKVIEFGGGILVGGIILVIGNFLSNIAYNKLSKTGSGNLAGIAKFAILGLVLAMGLKSMGLADNIVTMAFGLTLGSVAVAGAIAFGLGGRDAAKTVTDRWAERIKK